MRPATVILSTVKIDKSSPLFIDAAKCKDCTLDHPHVCTGSDGLHGTPHSIDRMVEWCTVSPKETVVVLDRYLDGQCWLTDAMDGTTLIPRFAELGCIVIMRSGNSDASDRKQYQDAGAFDCIGKTMGGTSGEAVLDRVRAKLMSD